VLWTQISHIALLQL